MHGSSIAIRDLGYFPSFHDALVLRAEIALPHSVAIEFRCEDNSLLVPPDRDPPFRFCRLVFKGIHTAKLNLTENWVYRFNIEGLPESGAVHALVVLSDGEGEIDLEADAVCVELWRAAQADDPAFRNFKFTHVQLTFNASGFASHLSEGE
ncbi:MAG: hypothetical protein HYR64_00540 [Fimbriimonas ginsengisoli]|uniref:Uncharacterized protein n=1 Tax=Fimbriimonas ginsengisoli TaxID=1005039 RepID=A0A931PSR5_FIMGI|nr:hypothetical protein [Fimbriimonas ginsengisoli]